MWMMWGVVLMTGREAAGNNNDDGNNNGDNVGRMPTMSRPPTWLCIPADSGRILKECSKKGLAEKFCQF